MGKLKGLGGGNSHTEYKYKGLLNGLSMLLNTLEFLYDTLYFASFLCQVWEQIGKLLSLFGMSDTLSLNATSTVKCACLEQSRLQERGWFC